jgi:hypothetical protein
MIDEEEAVREAFDDSDRRSPVNLWKNDIEPRFHHGGGGGGKRRADTSTATVKLVRTMNRALLLDDDARRERLVKRAMRLVRKVDDEMRAGIVMSLERIRDRYTAVLDAVKK